MGGQKPGFLRKSFAAVTKLDKTAVETASTQTMSASADSRKNVILTIASSTRGGVRRAKSSRGFCLCRRGFNRPVF